MEPAFPKKESFALNLLCELSTEQPTANILISPLSISIILSLTMNGAIGNTQQSIMNALNKLAPIAETNKVYQSILQTIIKEDKNMFNIANAVFTAVEPLATFIKTAEDIYCSNVDKLISKEQVNKWISEQTNNRINQVIDSIQGIDMILVNTVYFLGKWKYSFDPKKSQIDEFHGAQNKASKVVYMREKLKKPDVIYFENDDVQVLELPYKEFEFSAIIILPRTKLSLDAYISKVNETEIHEYMKSGSGNVSVNLKLPKFEFKYSSNLKKVLSKMGMESCFGAKADFSALSEAPLFISDVIHKTFIKVDEVGTEAAAVTAVMMTRCMKIEQVFDMDVNRPFLFLIKKKNINDIIFMTKIMEVEN